MKDGTMLLSEDCSASLQPGDTDGRAGGHAGGAPGWGTAESRLLVQAAHRRPQADSGPELDTAGPAGGPRHDGQLRSHPMIKRYSSSALGD